MYCIHIGLPKTGTTFLQEEIFPKWEGINYLGKTKKKGKHKNIKHLITINPYENNLISDEEFSNPREFNIKKIWIDSYEQKELVISNLSKMFPNARIILSFRKHHEWLTSLYKQTFKHGYVYPSFNDFFDIYDNKGTIKKENINYKFYIDLVEKYFDQKPFIFLQEELSNNLSGVLKDLEHFIGGSAPDIENVKLNKANKGVGYYQATLLKHTNNIFPSRNNPDAFLPYNTSVVLLGKILKSLIKCYFIYLPDKRIKIDKEQKKLTEKYYQEDWSYIIRYINCCPYRNNFNYKG